ncbi:ImmA/IrrE family metallo-endopeptidase [Lachnospiraceae bacterium MD335]|nr:ImmA/IrrE family metallo-endopeptidase [Lachnospiraceae bacterium MD335]
MSEYITSFNGERLKAARLYNAMTISDVAERAGVSKQALSQFETNKSEPKLETMITLAAVLGFPRDFFYNADQNKAVIGDTYFRSLAATTNKERSAQIERVKIFVSIINVIKKYIEFPELQLYDSKDLKQIDVEELATGLRKIWGLKQQPIFNIVDEMERHGILVSSVFTNNHNIDAYSQLQLSDGKETAIVVLGSDKDSAFRRNFSAAHELGHLLLDDFYNVNDMSKLEYKEMEDTMNRFAGALLIPTELYAKDLMTASKTDLNLYIQLKRKYHVSAAALIVRARQLELITQNQYQYLMKQLSQKGYRTCEPFDKETPLMKPRYVHEAMKMIIEEDGVTGKEFMEELSMQGMALQSSMVEEILNLPDGYLMQNDEKGELVRLYRK